MDFENLWKPLKETFQTIQFSKEDQSKTFDLFFSRLSNMKSTKPNIKILGELYDGYFLFITHIVLKNDLVIIDLKKSLQKGEIVSKTIAFMLDKFTTNVPLNSVLRAWVLVLLLSGII